MSISLRAIIAIVKKDLYGLLPLVILALVVSFVAPVISSLNLEDIGGDTEFWIRAQANFYYLTYFIAALLMVSVLQQDPADSLNNDWLTRPVNRIDLLLAKLGFLFITIFVPVVLARFIVNLNNDLGPGLSLSYALGIEKLGAVIPIPLLFATALLAPNLRKTILLIMAVFMLILLPGWSVTRPILQALGINILANEFDGMAWLQGMPMFFGGLIAAGLVYWFYYCKRMRFAAYLTFSALAATVFFSIFPPASLYDWDRAIAIHKSMINGADAALEEEVILNFSNACFPAASLANDTQTEQESALLANAAWLDMRLAEAGPEAITFATTVNFRNVLVEWYKPAGSQREIMVDWRLDRVRTRGYFTSDSLAGDLPIRRSNTARNRYAPIARRDTDYWLVPGEAAAHLAADPSTRFHLEYDVALLKPAPYELPTDGRRYEFPELGSCRAELDENANAIDIECIKHGPQPDLVSAELLGLEASRVDNASRTNFTADWVEALGRRVYELTLQPASLVDNSTVQVTAYKTQRILHKELVSSGVLGDSRNLCPLPSDQQYASVEQSSWSDRSPHEISSVAVERGVRLEVLDWRNGEIKDAPTLLLLPGLGATAHSYDDAAPEWAQKYNVVGMTRRGAEGSSKPDRGYNIERLSQDVLQVMETLGIENPILIGMSIAGEELSYLGAHYPERFQGLVYLDAAYDRTSPSMGGRHYHDVSVRLPEAPPPRPAETASYAAMLDYARRLGRSSYRPEGEMIASYDLSSGALLHDNLYLNSVMRGLQAPEYEKITIPVLGIFALPVTRDSMMEPWYDQDDPEVQEAVSEMFRMDRAIKLQQIEAFDKRIPDSEVVLLEDGNHWVFIGYREKVMQSIESFIQRVQATKL